MNNHVTPQTAIILEEFGFPKPEPEFGQVWYAKPELIACVCVYNILSGIAVLRVIEKSETCYSYGLNPSSYIFAPTDTDILKELKWYSLDFDIGTEAWNLCISIPLDQRIKIQSHKNPAELCALAWLSKQKG